MVSSRLALTIIISAVLITIGVNTVVQQQIQHAHAAETVHLFNEAPIVTSDGNVYVIWWSNKTGNNEVMFRASNDNGLTFTDKINLSNSTDTESVDAEITADGENVYVTWWERNQTAEEPVLRSSNDGGQTFMPILKLSVNGTIGES
jgi:hypothetical protein